MYMSCTFHLLKNYKLIEYFQTVYEYVKSVQWNLDISSRQLKWLHFFHKPFAHYVSNPTQSMMYVDVIEWKFIQMYVY